MSLVVLKVSGEYIEWGGNHKQKFFVWIRHGCFIVGSRIDELLLEIFHMEEHYFGFIGYN